MFRSPLRGRRVVIHTKRPDDQTIAGVLVAVRHAHHKLEDAEYVASASERHPLDHPVYVPNDHIAWIEDLA